MGLINQLSTALGMKNSEPNLAAAQLILAGPSRMEEIAAGLVTEKNDLLADCAEVCTMVAEKKPEIVAPHVEKLVPLLDHKKTRVRWEAMHALAYCAPLRPDVMAGLMGKLDEILRTDKSTIVRDYAITALGNYGQLDQDTAQAVLPILKIGINIYDGKHAKLVLEGYQKMLPHLGTETVYLQRTAENLQDHPRGTVKKAAKQLLKKLSN